MNNRELLNILVIWLGTGLTWVLTIMDLIVSIAVGCATLVFTGIKLYEIYARYNAKKHMEPTDERKKEKP